MYKKISELNEVESLNIDDYLVVIHDGETVKVKVSNLLDANPITEAEIDEITEV